MKLIEEKKVKNVYVFQSYMKKKYAKHIKLDIKQGNIEISFLFSNKKINENYIIPVLIIIQTNIEICEIIQMLNEYIFFTEYPSNVKLEEKVFPNEIIILYDFYIMENQKLLEYLTKQKNGTKYLVHYHHFGLLKHSLREFTIPISTNMMFEICY